METIAARGSVSQYKLTDMNVEISELVARQEDLRVALAQAEGRLVEAEIAQAKIEQAHSVEIENELAATQQEIDDGTHAIVSMQAVIQVLRNGLPEVAGGSPRLPSLSITRRVAEGYTVITATETTLLLPGDVVQVNSDNRVETPTSGIAQDLHPS